MRNLKLIDASELSLLHYIPLASFVLKDDLLHLNSFVRFVLDRLNDNNNC
jgi:hypothetical protein